MLGRVERFIVLATVSTTAAWCCHPAVADEVICTGIQNELATLEYSFWSGRDGIVSVKLPQRVYWEEDRHRYVRVPSATADAEVFKFVRLELAVRPKREDSGRLELNLDLDARKAEDDDEEGGIHRSAPVPELHASIMVGNVEGSVLSLTAYYWSTALGDDWGGCVSHLIVDIDLPDEDHDSADANDDKGDGAEVVLPTLGDDVPSQDNRRSSI